MRRWRSSRGILECLVDAEICDLQTEWIDANEVVGDLVPEHEVDLRHVRLPAALSPRTRRVQDLLERHGGLEWRCRELAEAHVVNDDVHFVCGRVCQEHFDRSYLLIVCNGGVG